METIEIKGLGVAAPEFFLGTQRGMLISKCCIMPMYSIHGKAVKAMATCLTETWFLNGQKTNGVRVAWFSNN